MARSALVLAVLATLIATAMAAPVRSVEENNNNERRGLFVGNVAIAFFGDANNVAGDYSALLAGVKLAITGRNTIKTFAAPADAAAVAAGVTATKNAVNFGLGVFSSVKVFVVAHSSAGPAVEAYLAAADASVVGAIFLGYLPTATSFAVPSQIIAGQFDGVSTADRVAYRYTDRAEDSNVAIAIIEGATNAHFASGVRKYAQDINRPAAFDVAASRVRITLAISAWINAATTSGTLFALTGILADARLRDLDAKAAAFSAPWAEARRQDLYESCNQFQAMFINANEETAATYTMHNWIAPNGNAFTQSKSYIWPSNRTIAVPTWIWTADAYIDPAYKNFSPDALACKGKTRAQVASILFPGVATSTLFGAQLDGRDVHQAQFSSAFALADADAQERFIASGKTLEYVADNRAPTNGPTYLSDNGPYLFRADAAANPNAFSARMTVFQSADACSPFTPPQFCGPDFLSSLYNKSVGVRTFLKFITITALQD
ncbi:hypothetical protein CAOG_01278 [Capsaspora owczarzaki ATCC 30864]|uniref:Receptor ligand binding region domain-containing protein n=1 Tax=Capsaspora owczarzaki (strain ATCC 30864) TaxID=595528 RepID=A0A0D2X0Y3_CAPO3|nr:hypothetical protein CAOG_01278 [Capsaspora owczarzaki ATCC 30864]KJE89859.1 hypothetical protein CAOG_001278 [Capsaspora owczarzaki ATCC 30864]|eukprot:XP_004349798.1 hypothetical protein CAOG_01278 [Capsaspora owczarzaki ATCC 30864]